MVSFGYVVVCVDGCGIGGCGSEFQKCIYLNLGVKEVKDQVEVVKYLGGLFYVDKGCIGIWGWSFGGYMIIMSMSEGIFVFKVGVVVVVFIDWKYYDIVYIECFMCILKENVEGYKVVLVFSCVDNLYGNLFFVYGMVDDNVYFQNCIEYVEYLV